MYGRSLALYLRAIALQVDPYGERQLHTPTHKEPEVNTPLTPVATSLPLPPAIQEAVAKKIAAEVAPLQQEVEHLTGALQAYQQTIQREAAHRVENAVLTALGLEEKAPFEDQGATENLRTALSPLCARLGLVGTLEREAVKEETPSSPPPVTPQASPEVLRKAGWVIDEIEGLSGKVRDQPRARFEPLLQALVAEARLLMSQMPTACSAHTRLSQLIPVLTAMKTEAGITGFIKGLAYGADYDWARISAECRRQVKRFDQDTTTPISSPTPKSVPKSAPRMEPPLNPALPWPALPNLRKMLAKQTLVIAGGLVVNEKLDLCQTRFGIKAVWHEIDDSMPATETLCQRIRSGSVGAVILLEGLIGHKQSNKVVDACRANQTPYMMGDRGGTASIEAALHTLDSKLGTR